MTRNRTAIYTLILLLLTGCGQKQSTAPETLSVAGASAFANLAVEAPAANKIPVEIEQHDNKRVDNYGWLRDPQWQAVLREPEKLSADIRTHLEAENAYYEGATGSLDGLRETVYSEIRGRIKENDSTVPMPDGPYAYFRKYRDGGEYPVFSRIPRDGGEETILLDGDDEGEGETFFRIVAVAHSPNHELIAYGIDRVGSEYYDIRIRNIATGEEHPETITSTGGRPVWASDSRSFYYIERDDNQRPKWVKQHILGTDPADDILVYEEPDDSFFITISLSQSGDYVFINSGNLTLREAYFLRRDAVPGTTPTVIAPRSEELLYEVDHAGDYFYIRTNAGDAVDFKIVRTPVDKPGSESWETFLPHQSGNFVRRMLPLKDRFIRLETVNAQPRLVVSDYALNNAHEIEFDEAAYSIDFFSGYEFDTDILRFTYESPSTPQQVVDFSLENRKRTLRKTREIPSGHKPELYAVERVFISADDGAEIPVTILRLKTTPVDGSAALLLYGYGSYGITISANFNSHILSLVDRGVIYAIAHVRGGTAKGHGWYLDGKLEKKMNTFTDFNAVAEGLQKNGFGRKGETVIYGGSAGGLLVGAAMNLRPDLYAGVIAMVPFVDVINTISDDSLPLTPMEWLEWGNPITDPAAWKNIVAYSPYENIRDDIDYPAVLATGGLTDYRVTYWEPAKWIARLRDDAQGGPFLLKMNMGAGHAGSAARFEAMKERTHAYTFALELFGLSDKEPVSHE
jgi:oligopeptidase B